MTDLNTMMRDQARAGLQTQLDAAVTAGDTEAARKITTDIEKLAVSTAPKTPPYGPAEIAAQLDKQPWYGVDPKKSARALELGKSLDIRKFATAEAFAAALVKVVDDEFKAPVAKPKNGEDAEDEDGEDAEDEDGEDAEDEDGEDAEGKNKKKSAKRRTDGPSDADRGGGTQRRRTPTGPWTKITDAPKEVQAEIKRSAAKFVPANATKERREAYITKALESHYAAHQRTAKGKK